MNLYIILLSLLSYLDCLKCLFMKDKELFYPIVNSAKYVIKCCLMLTSIFKSVRKETANSPWPVHLSDCIIRAHLENSTLSQSC